MTPPPTTQPWPGPICPTRDGTRDNVSTTYDYSAQTTTRLNSGPSTSQPIPPHPERLPEPFPYRTPPSPRRLPCSGPPAPTDKTTLVRSHHLMRLPTPSTHQAAPSDYPHQAKSNQSTTPTASSRVRSIRHAHPLSPDSPIPIPSVLRVSTAPIPSCPSRTILPTRHDSTDPRLSRHATPRDHTPCANPDQYCRLPVTCRPGNLPTRVTTHLVSSRDSPLRPSTRLCDITNRRINDK